MLDGTSVPVLLAVSGFDLDGMLLRCLVLTDLSAQRAAEAQAAAAHQALRVSEERLRALVRQRAHRHRGADAQRRAGPGQPALL